MDDADQPTTSLDTRLPAFQEVLSRRTRPPVDLYMLYLFLQREGAEDVLDFWLDVQSHENLCRAYFKDLRKSGRTVREEWPQYWEYARRRGSIYGTVIGAGAATKRSTASTGEMLTDHEKAALAGERPDADRDTPATLLDQQRAATADEEKRGTPFSFHGRLGSTTPSALFGKRASRAPTVIPRSAAITRLDLVASAERIFLRYLAPGAPKEIYLPPSLRIHAFPLSANQLPRPSSPEFEVEQATLAQVPDMFHAQKEYVFRAMEQEAFPRFLRAKAFGNLTPVSALVRLVAGLIVLWAGLATAFALIFLDVIPKSKRFFLFIPFLLAMYLLLAHQYELDPILVFLGQSESTPFRTLRIREKYVGKLLLGRAIWVSVLIALLGSALTLIFWAVPGHRL